MKLSSKGHATETTSHHFRVDTATSIFPSEGVGCGAVLVLISLFLAGLRKYLVQRGSYSIDDELRNPEKSEPGVVLLSKVLPDDNTCQDLEKKEILL